MTKVIWLGEDTETTAGPSFNIWNGVKFPKGVEVEVTDPYMLGKLRRMGENRFYKVIEDTKQEDSHGESQTQGEGKSKEQGETREKKDNGEKGTGYSPIKKKVRKKKLQERTEPASDTSAGRGPGTTA